MGNITETFTLTSRYDGLPLSTLVIRPSGRPTAVLQIAHGMCGCKERFIPFMEFMADNGIACIASDHRGHGGSIRSAEDLGFMYAGGYMALVNDMKTVTDHASDIFKGLPVVLLGHSMGSLAARVYAKKHSNGLDGLIICGSPSWNPASVIGIFLCRFLCLFNEGRMRPRIIQKLTSDRYNRRFASEGPQAWTCSDPAVRKSFADNPLCNFRFTANGALNLLCMMRETYSRKGWKDVNHAMPVRFLSGLDDPCMISEKKFQQSISAMHDAGFTYVTARLFPGMRHEVLNEKEKEEVWYDILSFILKAPMHQPVRSSVSGPMGIEVRH